MCTCACGERKGWDNKAKEKRRRLTHDQHCHPKPNQRCAQRPCIRRDHELVVRGVGATIARAHGDPKQLYKSYELLFFQ
jgi:hypothetical protein